MIRMAACILLLLVGVYVRSDAQAQQQAVSIGFTQTLKSDVLKEERTINVYLPPSYRTSYRYRRYPVLYLRDGGKFFHSFTGVVEQLASDATPRAPEMLVIAIVENDRVRDSSVTHSMMGFTGKDDPGFETSGGGKKLSRFLEAELIPYIDTTFSTSAYRIYCGYSFTGLSVIEEWLAEKNLFNAYVAIDPSWWWDDYVTERRVAAAPGSKKFDRAQLFMAASGERYPTNYFIEARDVESLDAMLKKTRPLGLEWRFQRYDDESHHSLPQAALYDGLSFIFDGHKPTLDELYNRPTAVRERYANLSDRLGRKMMPREDLLNFFAYQFLYAFKEPDKAMTYLHMNAEYYPESPNVWDSLGEAYALKGERATAVKMYEKSLALAPDNTSAQQKLLELRDKR